MTRPDVERGVPVLTRSIGYGCLAGYVGWNAWWLIQGRLAPSILLETVHLPAPTTGLTRSLVSLSRGEIGVSFLWNPFAVPIMGLLFASAGSLGVKFIRGKPLLLEGWLARGWLIVLAAAWVVKLATGPAWW